MFRIHDILIINIILIFSYSTDQERLMFRHLILENLLETLESAISRMKQQEVQFNQHDETHKVSKLDILGTLDSIF